MTLEKGACAQRGEDRSDRQSTGQPAGGYPEGVHPNEGPYTDVHVETAVKLGAAALFAKAITEAVAPNTSALVEYGEASPTELLSAAAWDAVSALEPTGVSELINWSLDL